MEGTERMEEPKASWEGAQGELASVLGHKRKITLHSCGTCRSEEAKYRCPRCMKYSCSLPCVKKHKKELGCSGVRDKAAFIATNKFTDLNLLNDYRFLEDVGRSADVAARDVLNHVQFTTRSLQLLKREASRRDTNLMILPIGFTKRRANSTYFDRKLNDDGREILTQKVRVQRKRNFLTEAFMKGQRCVYCVGKSIATDCITKKLKKFFWCLKLLFPQSQAEYFKRRVPEDKTLHEILKLYIDPTASDPVIRQRLKAYVWAQSGVTVFMKVEKRKCDSVRYYELDCSKSLLENLKNKTIIEYPTLYVTLNEFKQDFVVLGKESCTLSKPTAPSSMQ